MRSSVPSSPPGSPPLEPREALEALEAREPREARPAVRVGVVGAGPMGTALVTHLVRAGHPVGCYDLRPDALDGAVAAGASAASSPADLAARSGLVLTFLPGPAQVREVALDPAAGVLAGLPEGGLMLDMSTCGPATAEELGAAFAARGRRFVDCPVSRKAPDMTVLVGGEPGVLGAAEDILRSVSRSVLYCGRAGAGYTVKLLNQHVKYAWYLASVEALAVSRALGVDPGLAADAIEQCSGGESGLSTAATYFRGDTDGMRTHAPSTTIAKDMELARGLAELSGVPSAALHATADFFTRVTGTPYRDLPYPESSALLSPDGDETHGGTV
ncbi:NAD(P)-dependent oxidoreductase [Streptomyces sp. NPDC050560]|uniref:NAD(P)-dependent oxidoreductase n=1 Tax=Streptomyces sp. NPDC050560 TaxID=3365630 RepID=UPI00379839F3